MNIITKIKIAPRKVPLLGKSVLQKSSHSDLNFLSSDSAESHWLQRNESEASQCPLPPITWERVYFSFFPCIAALQCGQGQPWNDSPHFYLMLLIVPPSLYCQWITPTHPFGRIAAIYNPTIDRLYWTLSSFWRGGECFSVQNMIIERMIPFSSYCNNLNVANFRTHSRYILIHRQIGK